MINQKINQLIFPLLFSLILLFTAQLNTGQQISRFLTVILTPVSIPFTTSKMYLSQQLSFVISLPSLYHQNQELNHFNQFLLSQNQSLKDLITDKELLNKLPQDFHQTTPIRIVSIGNHLTATTSLDLSAIKIGQPVVSDYTLIGIVTKINQTLITITPLTDEDFPHLNLKTNHGHRGNYTYDNRLSQIINVSSEEPLQTNDTIFTEASAQIPANLIIGSIKNLITQTQSPLQKAEIKLEKSPQQLQNLYIITRI